MSSKRRRAIGAAAIVSLIIIASAVGATSFVLLASSSQSKSSTQSSADGVQVINANVTIHGKPAFIGVCEAIQASCPLSEEMNATISVELISYNGAYYYVHNDTVVSGGASTMTHTNSTGGLNITTLTQSQSTVIYTAWFTNSTLYCVSPSPDTVPACPVQL